MDSGPAHNVGNSHLHHGDNGTNFGVDFLGSLQNFANNGDQDDMQQYFHPDLFDTGSQDFNSSLQQQPQQQPQQSHQSSYSSPAFSQNVAQRTQSPAMPNYNQSQQYSQHSQYGQQMYPDHRGLFQPQYDPRIFQQQPSHSPSPLDQYPFTGQNYTPQSHQGQLNIQPRPSPSPAPQYPPRQQQYSPFMTFDSRGPTLPQRQDADLIQFANFQNPGQGPSTSFVNPSMLNAEPNNPNGHYGSAAQRQAQQQYYQGLPPVQQQQIPGMSQTLQPNAMQAALSQFAPVAGIKPGMKDPNAPKKPRGRPRKDGSIPGVDGGSGSASSSDLEIEDEEPEPAPAMISVSPPTDERVRAVFNAVKAVWYPRNKTAPVEKIKSGVVDFGETIKTLRDAWKARNESLKKAEHEGSSTAADAPRLKAEVAQYRQTMENLINKSMLFAHPAIIRSLGENLYTLSALYSFLLDRVTAVDYESPLLLATLKLAETFATLDEEKLESSKWIKALQRVSKKASGETKILAQQIMDNAKAATARNKKAAELKGAGETAAGVKRAREGEVAGPAAKKMVKPSSKPLALQNAEKRRAQEAAEAAKKGKTGSATTGGTLITPAAAKPKAPLAATKAASFASLMSASKKPGTTNAERLAAVKKDGVTPALQQVRKEPVKRESPPASGVPAPIAAAAASKGSSFLSGLFSQEKKEVKPKKEDEALNETPEEKTKRLRKESRRKLRVSWKHDNELVETRFFTHDPEEEIKRGDSAMKDAGDTGKEGEMLKRSMAIDDEDDSEEEGDFDPDSYTEPDEVDFSELASEECDPALNGIKHGGTMVAESKSKEAQDKLEETSIMTIYATASDRPETPKEPVDEGDDDFTPIDEFGEPEERVRAREKDMYARRRFQGGFGSDGHADFGTTLQAMAGEASAQHAAPSTPSNNTDLLAQLRAIGILQQPAAQPAPAPAPAPAAAPAPFDLSQLVASVAGQGNAQTYQAPAQQLPPDTANTLQAIMAKLQQTQSAMQPSYQPPVDDYDGGKKNKKGKKSVPVDENGRPLNYKTKVCEFWEKGTCTYGDDCNFRHSK
ncbi:uncharacterized protein HMPREF1541_03418 [Cyphellophora europaea CBS 101466]|uniref:C3H1-type domain-containing protein n=1 Tax=Cyphellophora europaea (strain CBS 101466) TaxID=1220924 RepID=W2RYH0_CYPE1|nr:uncharacterized protein HMPREF1541_03418 [Cyphellophora europaea CBS 101466]ETN41482.1 hypothetical protein HMPREF1541_03418 [Cyphellophora europaea CBS 101466]